MSLDFQEFVADPRLGRVLEALKRSNDIFGIIDPTENQHSEILKWLFDPREGHGQGDALLKDFLTAAYEGSGDNVLSNKDFFNQWTPSRIARTGFHSMIAMREYVLPSGCRLDLLMVDPVNEMILVVENKYGAKLGQGQLSKYYGEVAVLRARAAFKGYKTAHIVLDRNYGAPKEEGGNSQQNRWAFLDYQWLKAGADRAELQVKRGNQSAGLVVAYCQKQTDYIPPEQKEIDDFLADVAFEYKAVVESLTAMRSRDISSLTKSEMEGDVGERWIFSQHYPELVDRLASQAKFVFVEKSLRSNFPLHQFDVDHGKKSLWFTNKRWDSLIDDSTQCWPVFVTAWEMRDSTEGNAKFAVGVRYRHAYLAIEHKEMVQQALEDAFPELKGGRRNANYRTLGKVANLPENLLAARTQAIYGKLEKALAPIVAGLPT